MVGAPPPVEALSLYTRAWHKNTISRGLKRFTMRDSDHLARLDERKPKTMFLHRLLVVLAVTGMGGELLIWLPD
jgi:hypothetical protein